MDCTSFHLYFDLYIFFQSQSYPKNKYMQDLCLPKRLNDSCLYFLGTPGEKTSHVLYTLTNHLAYANPRSSIHKYH